MEYVKETFSLYVNNFWKITLLALTICLPFLLVHGFTSNVVYYYVSYTPAEIFGDYTNLFLSMVFFVLVQIPLIKFIQMELNGEENQLSSSYHTFFIYGFMAFLFAILYISLIVIGITLFVLPGIIVLILFYFTPYVMIYKKQNPFRSLGTAFRLAKKHFFKILLIILAMGLIDNLFSSILLLAISGVSSDYLSIFFGQLLLNLIFFPLLTIYTTCRFHDWFEELEEHVPVKKLH
ncbi:hypothetical protein [Caldifermentibacillus hisashii]|uniref:hypothetical protein n=1 Tax=Caldifermentibacillus hisashii TaxID=996558 RepID=UPI003100B5A7